MRITWAPGHGRSQAAAAQLLSRITTRQARVGVLGLGREGLPVAVAAAKAGFGVLGIDPDPERVETLAWGLNYLPEVDDAALAEAVGRGRLEATTELARLADLDVVIIAPATPADQASIAGSRELAAIAAEVAQRLRPGQLVCLRGAVPPGTMSDVLRPILEAHGLRVEQDFYLALAGQVVGGLGPASLEVARAFHAQLAEAPPSLASMPAAELASSFGRMFQAVNAALVNELAMLCERMALDVSEVLDAANTKPFGIMPCYPGLAPAAPDVGAPLVALANQINRQMPAHVRGKARRALNARGVAPSRASVLIVGLGAARAPVFELMRLLAADGMAVSYHDPHVPTLRAPGLALEGVALEAAVVAAHDLVLVAADRPGVDYAHLVTHARQVLDLCGATRALAPERAKVARL